jgi:hypothetical protein
MQLHDALAQITEIRSQMARTQTFRGYRSATVAFSGLLALLVSAAQAAWIPHPQLDVESYVKLWAAVAALSVAVVAFELVIHCRRAGSPLTTQVTWLAVQQFAPCILIGGVTTEALVRFSPESLWLLPGLWAMMFSLGVFSSCRLLPKPMFIVGGYYLLAGLACFSWASGEHAFSPWAMAGTFGGGQFLSATLLYFTLERNHESR